MLLFRDGTLKRSNFRHYEPPKVAYKLPNVTLPWVDVNGTSPKEIASFTGWDKSDEGDFVECDNCQEMISWQAAVYRKDTESPESWQFCHDCSTIFDYQAGDVIPGVYEEITPTMAEVNEAILEQFLKNEKP
jgi:hypothetical protein